MMVKQRKGIHIDLNDEYIGDEEEFSRYKDWNDNERKEEHPKQKSYNSGKYGNGDAKLRTQVISMVFQSLEGVEEFYNGY